MILSELHVDHILFQCEGFRHAAKVTRYIEVRIGTRYLNDGIDER